MNYVYLFRCKDGSLYCGSTNNLEKRELAHNTGKGSKYVASRGGGKIVYSENLKSLKKALQREAAIKNLPRQKNSNL